MTAVSTAVAPRRGWAWRKRMGRAPRNATVWAAGLSGGVRSDLGPDDPRQDERARYPWVGGNRAKRVGHRDIDVAGCGGVIGLGRDIHRSRRQVARVLQRQGLDPVGVERRRGAAAGVDGGVADAARDD